LRNIPRINYNPTARRHAISHNNRNEANSPASAATPSISVGHMAGALLAQMTNPDDPGYAAYMFGRFIGEHVDQFGRDEVRIAQDRIFDGLRQRLRMQPPGDSEASAEEEEEADDDEEGEDDDEL
jgi:hypothetical protein